MDNDAYMNELVQDLSGYEDKASKCEEESLLRLGVLYYWGWKDIPKDINRAIKYWRTADLECNSGAAYLFLGKNYSRYEFNEEDLQKTLQFYTNAVKNGNKDAFFLLGYMYLFGFGTVVDYKKAKELLTLAKNNGDANGMFYLAIMYEDGIGMKPNIQKAFQLYQQASQLGSENAQIRLYNLAVNILNQVL